MYYGGAVVQFDLERLIKVSLHEPQQIHLVCEKLQARACSQEIKVEETMGFTALKELGNLRQVLAFQTRKVDSLEGCEDNIISIQVGRSE